MFLYSWRKEIGIYSHNKEQLKKGPTPVHATTLMDPKIIVKEYRFKIIYYMIMFI